MSLRYSIENNEILISGKTFIYREALKALGARFDSQYKIWRVTHSPQAEKSIQKLCQTLGVPTKSTTSRQEHAHNITTFEKNREPNEKKPAKDYTLSRLLDELSYHIQQKFNQPVWIIAEISSLNLRNNSFFVNLTENKKNKVSASTLNISAIIWKDIAEQLKKKLKKDFDLVLQEGVKIRAKVQVNLYKDRGQVSLGIVDIDPSYTKGELALTKEKVILELKKLSLFDRNKQLLLPTLPFKIGFITAAGSRAYSDFVDQLQQSNFPGEILFCGALMQGENCVSSIQQAYQKLMQYSPDCIVITRGGGSQADLLWFDDLELCKTFANCTVPVIAAIGHHDDHNILEMISYRREKTPTAAAEFLVGRFRDANLTLEKFLNRLKQSMNKYIAMQEKRMQGIKERIYRSSLHRVSLQKEYLKSMKKNLKNTSLQVIQTEMLTLSKFDKIIATKDPKPWLNKGWTQLYQGKQRVTAVQQVNISDDLQVRLKDGSLTLKVTDINKDKDHAKKK